MIKYVQEKKINYDLMSSLLYKSQKTNQFTNKGPAKKALERKLKNLLNLNEDRSVLCVANGTLALHIIYLFLLKNNPHIKIVSPSYTFPSCVVGFNQVELKDICNKSYTLHLEEDLLSKYDVFVLTNLFGTYPNNISNWISEAKKRNKVLIFDNASSPLSTVNGTNICNLGDFSFGSLHHTKFLGFGEGGFIVCPTELYCEMEKIAGFGFEDGPINRVHNYYSSNYKMSDIAAAAIHQHIDNYDFERHLKLQDYFIKNISKFSPKVRPFNFSDGVFYGNMPVLYNKKISVDLFRKNNIESQKYYYPLKQHAGSLELFDKIMNFPLYSSMSYDDMDKIIQIIGVSLNE